MERQPYTVTGGGRTEKQGIRMKRKKRKKSRKPLRNCNAQRFLFIEAGLELKNDIYSPLQHNLTTQNTCILIDFWNQFPFYPFKIDFRFSATLTLLSLPYTINTYKL